MESHQEQQKESDMAPKRQESLLGQVLSSSEHGDQVMNMSPPRHHHRATTPSSVYSNNSSLPHGFDPIIPVHSDFTIPTSNVSPYTTDRLLQELNKDENRRLVFGGRVEERYHLYNNFNGYHVQYPGHLTAGAHNEDNHWSYDPHESCSSSLLDASTTMTNAAKHRRNLSDITTPPISPTLPSRNNSRDLVTTSSNKKLHHRRPKPPVHETIHAQSLLLGFAFMAIWSPQNCMAPNLTEMASDFGFSDAKRDFYLGANIALATGVLSLPISAGIGILADVWNRKYLFCATVALGGVSSYLTGISRTYRALFWARLLNGAFMSGSVPVAFSLLGDLFNTSERNAASSGLTAMMGLGIILGQVYAGVVGSSLGWPHPFYVSAIVTLISAFLVLLLVKEPVRGGKEEVLQDMLKRGTRYERKLTWSGFVQTMRNNESNMILMWQGFFSSVPWGIIFVFLNDYLSQERGFSVPDATYLVAVFGVGCAVGGILGGYWGGIVQSWNRSYLPLFMALTTLLGIFPFLGLLNGTFRNAHGLLAVGYSFLGGSIASLPSVCVRPCLINVNPPETRGAALTAANLIIQLARGAGPSCITLLGAILKLDRQFSFNVTLSVFWAISAIQLLFLSKSLPADQDAMEAELARYAASALAEKSPIVRLNGEDTLVSIEDRMTSWDVGAARESMQFMGAAIKEIGDEIRTLKPLNIRCADHHEESDDDNDEYYDAEDSAFNEDEEVDREYVEQRRQIWIQQQKQLTGTDDMPPSETTHLV